MSKSMKRIAIIAALAFVASCGNPTPKTESTTNADSSATTYYGEKISPDSAALIADLKALMGDKTELNIKLEATVDAVCQKKGCWMDLKTADGESMRVTFKDYAFFVPKDASGKTAIVEGVAKIEETSVADLQEYAKDAGKSKEDIAAITETKKELVFEASGVILK
jgi:hypothetical protein